MQPPFRWLFFCAKKKIIIIFIFLWVITQKSICLFLLYLCDIAAVFLTDEKIIIIFVGNKHQNQYGRE